MDEAKQFLLLAHKLSVTSGTQCLPKEHRLFCWILFCVVWSYFKIVGSFLVTSDFVSKLVSDHTKQQVINYPQNGRGQSPVVLVMIVMLI